MNIADYIKTGINEWPNWFNRILWRCNIFGPFVYGGSYRKLLERIDDVDAEKRLIDMANYAISHVPYYRNRYGNLHIGTIDDFKKHIRFIDKDEVMSHWDEFVADDTDLNTCVTGTTGGSSGKPMKILMPRSRYVHSLAFWHKEMKWYGWNYDTRAVIRNHRLKPDRDYMVNPILKEFIFDAFRMNGEYALKVWSVMKRYGIRYIHAYPSAAYQFLKYCRQLDLDTSFIKLCILTSESVTPEQRYFIKQELNIDIYSSYGHSEKLIMAGSCPASDKYHVEPAYGYCELVDREGNVIDKPGVFGELAGTTFFNKCFPLLRYRTGDYTSYADSDCTIHGNDYRLLNDIDGHWDKTLIYRSDGGYTSLTALNLHSDIFEHIDGLQYLQERIGALTVLIIPNDKYRDEDSAFLIRHYKGALGEDADIELRFVDKLIIQSNGKFQQLISKIKV